MKKHSIYFILLWACVTMLFPSCDDDDIVGSSEYNSERLFMPMFRRQQNTGESDDRYACAIASEAPDSESNYVNDVQLYWYGVTGASSYRLKAKIQGTDWDEDEVLDTILSPEVLQFLHEDLQYGVYYSYAIQAISPRGEEYNSKWYGYGDGSHQNDYMVITTGDRYDVPDLVWTSDVTETSLRVEFDQAVSDGYESDYAEFIEAGGEVVNGEWVFQEIYIEPTSDNPDLASITYTMTDTDFERGYVDFDGLVSNGAYVIYAQNNNPARFYDRQYNKVMLRMEGTPGDPILIPATVDPNDSILIQSYVQGLEATRIDTVLSNYMGDSSIAEGQVFYLEGGKVYYFGQSINLTKGFTLETNPEDLATKGRATVYLGVGYTSESGIATNTVTLMLSRNAESGSENGMMLQIQPITFNQINFQPQYYYSYMDQNGIGGNTSVSISANYFLNMLSQGLAFNMTELAITNCSFKGLTRGFIRFQGPNREIIENLIVDNCVFTDCGPYDTNGRGYAWFAGPGTNRNSNFYQNLQITNNSFIDCPKHAFVSENSDLAWPTGTTWNITIENNTFVNLSPRSTSSSHGLMFETRYPPTGSTITCRKNLFVMVRAGDNDPRFFYMRGIRIENPARCTFDFSDNYATEVPEWINNSSVTQGTGITNTTDGLFTNYAFSNSSNGAGYDNGALNAGGYDETRIKFGDNLNGNESDAVGYRLTPEELFQDPAPLAIDGYKDMHRHNVDGFYYNNTSRVTNHPIYTKNIGDQRWKTGAAWE